MAGGSISLGELITAGEQNTNAADSHQFEYFFRRAGSNVPAFSRTHAGT